MGRVSKVNVGLFAVAGLILLPWLFFIPAFDKYSVVAELLKDGRSVVLTPSFARGIVFCSIVAMLCVIAGYCTSLSLRTSKKNNLLPLLMLPSLCGPLVPAMFFKMVSLNLPLVATPPIVKLMLWGVVFMWCFVPLTTLIFILFHRTVPQKYRDFCLSNKLTEHEAARDVYAPTLIPLSVILFLIVYLSLMQDSFVGQLLYKASVGSCTSMIQDELLDIYMIFSASSPNYASSLMMANSILIIPTVILAGLLGSLLTSWLLLKVTKLYSPIKFYGYSSFIGSLMNKVGMLLIIIPVVGLFYFSNIDVLVLREILHTLIAPGVGALVLTGTTLIISFIVSKNTRSSENFLLMFLAGLIVAIKAAPPLGLVSITYEWTEMLGVEKLQSVYISWLMVQVFINLPFLLLFVIWTNRIVPAAHFELGIQMKMGWMQEFRYFMWTRLRAPYLLTFLFAFIFIWREASVAVVFSDLIPSATIVASNYLGAKPDFGKAGSIMALIISLSMGISYLWGRSLESNK